MKSYPSWQTAFVRGLILTGNMRLVVKNASKYWTNYAEGMGVFKFKSIGSSKVDINIGWTTDTFNLSNYKTIEVDEKIKDISIPQADGDTISSLIIHVLPSKGAKLFLGIHRLLNRQRLYELCFGEGVEIGPGTSPQILKCATVNIKYIEQSPPSETVVLPLYSLAYKYFFRLIICLICVSIYLHIFFVI